jgi:hypothetical protein
LIQYSFACEAAVCGKMFVRDAYQSNIALRASGRYGAEPIVALTSVKTGDQFATA